MMKNINWFMYRDKSIRGLVRKKNKESVQSILIFKKVLKEQEFKKIGSLSSNKK